MSKPEDFNEIEQLLTNLPVREPSQMLDERVTATLRHEQSALAAPGLSQHSVWRLTAIAAAVALAGGVALLLLLRDLPPAPDANSRLAQPPTQPDADHSRAPVLASSHNTGPVHLVWSRDVAEQTRLTPSGRPYRAVVRHTIDQRVWIDPETGATVQTTTPREELYIVEQPVF